MNDKVKKALNALKDGYMVLQGDKPPFRFVNIDQGFIFGGNGNGKIKTQLHLRPIPVKKRHWVDEITFNDTVIALKDAEK